MLAKLARLVALRRSRVLSGQGGGKGLWTGRPQTGTLLWDSVRAATGTPAPTFPRGASRELPGALSSSVCCPRSFFFFVCPPAGALAPWPRARPRPACLPPGGLPARSPRPGPGLGPGARPGGSSPNAGTLGARLATLCPCTGGFQVYVNFKSGHPAAFQQGLQPAAWKDLGEKLCSRMPDFTPFLSALVKWKWVKERGLRTEAPIKAKCD